MKNESVPIILENSDNIILSKLEEDLKDIYDYIDNKMAKEGMNKFGRLEFGYTSFPFKSVRYNYIQYTFFTESRIINFYTKKEKKLEYKESHFIYSPEYFIVISDNKNLNDSNISIEDYKTAFYDTSVKNILIYSVSNILTQENLNKKVIKDIFFSDYKIKELNLNSQKYFPNTFENFYIKSNIISNYLDSLSKFSLTNYNNILYLLGTKGCSKSTLLLMFVQTILNLEKNIGSMYFNISYMNDLSATETKKCLLKEALYLVSNINELDKFKHNHPLKKIEKMQEPICIVKNFIEDIIQNYNNIFPQNKEIIFIIDNYHIKNDQEVICLKDIITDINITKFNIKLIVSGTGNFFNEKIRHHFLNRFTRRESLIYMNNYNFGYPIINYKEIQNIPLYYFQYDQKENYPDFKKRMITSEKEYLKKFNFNILYYSLDMNKLSIPLEELETFTIYDYLPDYFYIVYQENNITFEINNQIFFEAIKETIQFMVQNNLYKNIIIEKKLPESACGFAEEYLIVLLFKYNRLNVKNLNNFKYIEKVEQIYNFQKDYFYHFNNKNEYKNILIIQNYNGKNYDLLAIITIEEVDYGIFIQIGVDKKESQIVKIKEDLETNYHKYIDNLNKIYNKNIIYINLLFIFDEKNQESKIHKIGEKSCGSKICEIYNIDYLWYSLENNELYKINFVQNIFKKKISLTEYIPIKFLLSKEHNNKMSLDNNKIKNDIEIKPFYILNSRQESIINDIIIKLYKGKYEFSSKLGKNFQMCIPREYIMEGFSKIGKTEIPYVHIFSIKNNNEIYITIDNNYFMINKNLQCDNQIEVNFQYAAWDIYKLKEKI